ncbi:intermediate filament tail domain protein, partial [Ancylostoma duodenale]
PRNRENENLREEVKRGTPGDDPGIRTVIHAVLGRVLKMVTEMGSATIGGISPALSANAAKSFLEATDKEKKELQGLNDRLGNYIDRVKRLEEQNRKLVADLDELRGKWGKDTSEIKIKYSESLSTARKDIDDSARRKAEIDVKVARLRDDLAEYRSRYEDIQHRREADREKIAQWTNAIADAQNELEMLRARWKQLTDEEKRLNNDNARIWEDLQKARNVCFLLRGSAEFSRILSEFQDLDEETIGRIDFQNQVQTLMEELEFLRRFVSYPYFTDTVNTLPRHKTRERFGCFRVHEQEVKELQALLAQAPADTREFFKNELALAIRDIKDEYDYIAKQGKQDMESWYKLKVSEVQGTANRAAMESNYQREEVKRMRDNIGDLRGKLGDLENKNALLEKEVQNLNYQNAVCLQLNDDQRQYEMALNDRDATLRRMREECQTLVGLGFLEFLPQDKRGEACFLQVAELQALLDTKQMLDAEIAIYRKMLEGEESRVGLRQMVEQVVKTHSLQQQEDTDSTRSVRGEVSTKTTFQRSAKGNVTIAECDPNGKFITLENTHRTKDENLGEHKLKRKLDKGREIVYTIPANTVLKAGRTMKIYARDQGGIHNPPDSLVFDGENTWGIGANVVTSLYNKEGEERATHTQKTIQTGI